MYSTFAWGKTDKDAQFTKFNIERNLPGDNDVQFEVLYCGICHTDVHYADPKFPMGKYPLVPGHELAGVVTKVGKKSFRRCCWGPGWSWLYFGLMSKLFQLL